MNTYIKGGIVALLLVVGLLALYQWRQGDLPANQSPVKFKVIDKMETEGVPDFELTRVSDGSTVKLSSFKGKALIVNFWASWCNPCVEEFPSMAKLVEAAPNDVTIIAISTDDDKKDIETFLKAFGLPKPNFEVLWDKDKKVMEMYGVDKIPESFLVGPDFRLKRKVLGIENWATDGAIAYFKALKAGQQ